MQVEHTTKGVFSMKIEKDKQLDIFLDSWFSEKSISARNAAINSLKKR